MRQDQAYQIYEDTNKADAEIMRKAMMYHDAKSAMRDQMIAMEKRRFSAVSGMLGTTLRMP